MYEDRPTTEQLEIELAAAKDLIMRLSESNLELEEAEQLRDEAAQAQEDARRRLEEAEDYAIRFQQEKHDFLATRQKIENEKSDWDLVKKKHNKEIQKRKKQQDAMFSSAVKQEVVEKIAKFRTVFTILAIYSVALTVVLVLLLLH